MADKIDDKSHVLESILEECSEPSEEDTDYKESSVRPSSFTDSCPNKELKGTKRKSPNLSESESIDHTSNSTYTTTSSDASSGKMKIPSNTRHWKRNPDLDNLRIYPNLTETFDSERFVRECIKSVIERSNYEKFIDKMSDNDQGFAVIRECMEDLSDVIVNLYTKLEDLEYPFCRVLEFLSKMKTDLKNWRDIWIERTSKLPIEARMIWGDFCSLSEATGQMFASQIEHMLVMKNETGIISEGMYQKLFMHFLGMFNLKAYDFTNIPAQTMETDTCTITSIPDILVMDYDDKFQNEIIAVIEMKKAEGNIEKVTPKRTRCALNQRDVSAKHNISNELIGQHGGELLVCLPKSIFKEKGIFGMIVQATKVSLTFFIPENNYLESVKKGCFINEEHATIKISKECNILLNQDRKKLLSPLLELYFFEKLRQLHLISDSFV